MLLSGLELKSIEAVAKNKTQWWCYTWAVDDHEVIGSYNVKTIYIAISRANGGEVKPVNMKTIIKLGLFVFTYLHLQQICVQQCSDATISI